MIKLINASNQIFFINLGHFIPKVPHVSDEDMTKRSNMVFFNTYRLDHQRPKVESLLKGREIRCWSSSIIVRATKIADTILYHQELAWKITRRLCLQGTLVRLHYMGIHWRNTEGRIFLYHILCNYIEALFQSNEAWHSNAGRAPNKVNHITFLFWEWKTYLQCWYQAIDVSKV